MSLGIKAKKSLKAPKKAVKKAGPSTTGGYSGGRSKSNVQKAGAK